MLSPVNTELQSRFARGCTDAAFGYARAMTAAYAAWVNQTLEIWTTAAKPTTERPSEDTPMPTYYVEAPRRMSAPSIPAPVDLTQMSNPWRDLSRTTLAPIAAWWGLAPFQTNPASWPMAYAMMMSGVPRSVALPAAEANVAAMDAANAATASFNQAFSSYRSASGFAMPPVIAPPPAPTPAFLTPFNTVSMLTPWFAMAGRTF